MSNNQQIPPHFSYPPIPPKKRHTVRNVVLGVLAGIFLVVGGCTAIVGGALSSTDTGSGPSSVATTVDTGPSPDPVVTPTNIPTAVEPTTEPPAPTTKPLTASQEQAVGAAEQYLDLTAFSRKGLIKQLSSEYGEGFSVKDATFAVDYLKVDWNAQAAAKAKEYLSMQHFSRKGLIQQLESAYGEQFTHKQAVYGVTKAGL